MIFINIKENWKCEMTDADEISLEKNPSRMKVLVHQPSSMSLGRRS